MTDKRNSLKWFARLMKSIGRLMAYATGAAAGIGLALRAADIPSHPMRTCG